MSGWVEYQGAVPPCSGGPQPGTAALMAALLDVFDPAFSMGIYNCREVGGGGAWSLHSQGRAADTGLPLVGGRPNPVGLQMVERVKLIAGELGVMEAIFNRVRWSANYPNGAYYGGESPHYDHVHWGQSWASARSLTYAQAVALLRGQGEGEGEEHEPFVPPRDEDTVYHIKVVGAGSATDEYYGHTDAEWWACSPEEARIFGYREQNVRERDVRRSRVFSIAALRKRGQVDLIKVVGVGIDTGKTFAVLGDDWWLPNAEELGVLAGALAGPVKQQNQRQWDIIKSRLNSIT